VRRSSSWQYRLPLPPRRRGRPDRPGRCGGAEGRASARRRGGRCRRHRGSDARAV